MASQSDGAVAFFTAETAENAEMGGGKVKRQKSKGKTTIQKAKRRGWRPRRGFSPRRTQRAQRGLGEKRGVHGMLLA